MKTKIKAGGGEVYVFKYPIGPDHKVFAISNMVIFPRMAHETTIDKEGNISYDMIDMFVDGYNFNTIWDGKRVI